MSFLADAISDVRQFTDEPTINAKYTDTILIRMIEQTYAHIVSEVNRCSTEPIVAKFDVTYVSGTECYRLPEYIQSIHSIYTLTTSGYKIFYQARSGYSPLGKRVWVEGKTLHIQSEYISVGDTVTVEYIPSGTAKLHNGTCTVDTTGKIVTFGATPTVGTLDTHQNAYAGCVLRIISDTDANYNYTQERTITIYNPITRKATLDVALSPNQGDGVHSGTTTYEIAPSINAGLDHAVAAYLAYWIVSIEASPQRANLLLRIWRDVIRNLRLTAYYSNLTECTKARADNFQNSRYTKRPGLGG